MDFEKVRDMIAKHLAVDVATIHEDSRLIEDLHADSLDLVELVMPMEPTRPMPRRSSGTKDMAMPLLRMADKVSALLQLFKLGGDAVHAVFADGSKPSCGVVPLSGEGQHGG